MATAKEIIEIMEGNDAKKKSDILSELSVSSSGVYEHDEVIGNIIQEKGNIRKLVEIGDESAVRLLALMFSHDISGDNGGEVCLVMLEERYDDCKVIFAKFLKACIDYLKTYYAKREWRKDTDKIEYFVYEIIYRILNMDRIKTDIQQEARKMLDERNQKNLLEKDNESIDALLKGWKRKS